MQMSIQNIAPKAAPPNTSPASPAVVGSAPDQSAPVAGEGDFNTALKRALPAGAATRSMPVSAPPQPFQPQTASATSSQWTLKLGTIPENSGKLTLVQADAPASGASSKIATTDAAPAKSPTAGAPLDEATAHPAPRPPVDSSLARTVSRAPPSTAGTITASPAASTGKASSGPEASKGSAKTKKPETQKPETQKPEVQKPEPQKPEAQNPADHESPAQAALPVPAASATPLAALQSVVAPLNIPIHAPAVPANPARAGEPAPTAALAGVSAGSAKSSGQAAQPDALPSATNAALKPDQAPFGSALAAHTHLKPADAAANPAASSSTPVPINLVSALMTQPPPSASATSSTGAASPLLMNSPLQNASLSGAGASSAAHQAAAAMISLGAGPDPGTQRLTIAMTPPDLGNVTIRIDRLPDGSASIAVSATHAATLASLHGDRSALEQALTQAGIPLQHRTMEFRLETPAASGGAGFASQNNAAGSDASSQQGRQAPSRGTPLAHPPPIMLAEPESAAPAMRRFGVNLTA